MERTAGIYMIQNTVTGDDYIGSSINIKERWRTHLWQLRRQTHFNSHLQNSWNKYGADTFSFYILEVTSKLRNRELYWIRQCTPTFNSTRVIERHDPDELGFCVSEDVRQKIRVAQIGIPRKPLTEAQKKKLSDVLRGKPGFWKGKKFSKETKKKLSEARKGVAKTEEHKRNMTKAQQNFWDSPAGDKKRARISEIQTGKQSHFTMRHPSPDEINNMTTKQQKWWESYDINHPIIEA